MLLQCSLVCVVLCYIVVQRVICIVGRQDQKSNSRWVDIQAVS